jgi:hypothetical protein
MILQTKRWLQLYEDEHEPRISCLVPTLPARVLDIGTSDDPKIVLREPGNVNAAHPCLSYCWSINELFQFTTANHNAFENQIAVEGLPPTSRYFYQIARGVGLRYGWKDALSFVQNDARDWDE